MIKHTALNLLSKGFMWVFHLWWLTNSKPRNFTVLVAKRIWSAYVKINGQ